MVEKLEALVNRLEACVGKMEVGGASGAPAQKATVVSASSSSGSIGAEWNMATEKFCTDL